MPFRELTEWSLQQRFALHKALLVSATMLVGVATMWLVEATDEAEQFDQHLQQTAWTLAHTCPQANVPRSVPLGLRTIGWSTTLPGADALVVQMWRTDGLLQLRSAQAPVARPLARLDVRGFSNAEVDGEAYRVYSLPGEDGQGAVQVGERLSARERHSLLMVLAYGLSLVIPLILMWRLTQGLWHRAAQVLNNLAARVEQRAPDDARPMPLGPTPAEFSPIVESLNRHVQRAARVISAEREFTALAAHELRSPMAGIRAHAQLAMKASSSVELQEELRQVVQAVDHASVVFDQLLDWTRIECMVTQSPPVLEPVRLLDVCLQVQSELQGQIDRKRMQLHLPGATDALRAMPAALYLIVRNLMANAVNYGPVGGTVQVALTHMPQGSVLSVDDDGPGIAPEERAQAFERYNRLHQSACEGLGLGLPIVARAVRLHQGEITLEKSPLGGLQVRVNFPTAAGA